MKPAAGDLAVDVLERSALVTGVERAARALARVALQSATARIVGRLRSELSGRLSVVILVAVVTHLLLTSVSRPPQWWWLLLPSIIGVLTVPWLGRHWRRSPARD